MKTSGFVVIEGNIGAGKSNFGLNLVLALRRLGLRAELLAEPDETSNPYLKDYYNKPERYALDMQVELLTRRFADTCYAQEGAQCGKGWFVMDRSYFGDLCFANVQRIDKYFEPRQWNTYVRLHHIMARYIMKPTAAIFLNVPVLECKERINERLSKKEGRLCESAINPDYLYKLQTEINNLKDGLTSNGTNVISVDWARKRTEAEINDFADEIAAKITCAKTLSINEESYSPWGDFFVEPRCDV